MDIFSIFACQICRDFVFGSKHFFRNRMGTIDSIMALKDHLGFKYVHALKSLANPMTKYLVSKCL